jgi:predicted membrane channel-forming protein YqfA (hemolysin III family)
MLMVLGAIFVVTAQYLPLGIRAYSADQLVSSCPSGMLFLLASIAVGVAAYFASTFMSENAPDQGTKAGPSAIFNIAIFVVGVIAVFFISVSFNTVGGFCR